MTKKVQKQKQKTKSTSSNTGTRKPETGNPTSLKNAGLLFAALSFLLYINTFNHKFAFDDAIVITQNSFTQQGLAGIPELVTTDFFMGIYGESGMELTGGRYRPLSLVMFAVESHIFGDKKDKPAGQPVNAKPGQVFYSYNAFVGHLFNVLFYAFSVFLLFQLLRRWFPERPFIALVSTLLFAVHPIHSEVVANIKSRDEIMSLFSSNKKKKCNWTLEKNWNVIF